MLDIFSSYHLTCLLPGQYDHDNRIEGHSESLYFGRENIF